jgi:hypothetical protein
MESGSNGYLQRIPTLQLRLVNNRRQNNIFGWSCGENHEARVKYQHIAS